MTAATLAFSKTSAKPRDAAGILACLRDLLGVSTRTADTPNALSQPREETAETARSRRPNAQLEAAAGTKTKSAGSSLASSQIPPTRRTSVLQMSAVWSAVMLVSQGTFARQMDVAGLLWSTARMSRGALKSLRP